MPFLSKAQQRKCYSLKGMGKAGSWNCKEWSDKTNQKSLPKKVSKSSKR